MRLRLAYGFVALVAILVLGTAGYHLIERASLWDAFYMTVITLTTVGYREVFPLSPVGQGFTAALLLVGLGLIFVLATEVGRAVLAGELRRLLGRHRRSRMLFRLQEHEVVCGYGRMGKVVNPNRLGGLRLAHLLVKPAVVDFLEVSLGPDGEELQLEEARVSETSPLANRSLSELELRRTFGVGVVAIRRGTSFIPNPEGSVRLEAGGVLVVIGTGEALAKFESLLLAQGGGGR